MTDLGNGLFAVSVPEDSRGVILSLSGKLWYEDKQWGLIEHSKGYGGFEILGTVTKDNISFDVEPYVDREDWDNSLFKDYVGDKWPFTNPKGSFRSLLSSKGLFFENPYGDKEPNYLYRRNKWQQAQNNLIEKLVIIKKL